LLFAAFCCKHGPLNQDSIADAFEPGPMKKTVYEAFFVVIIALVLAGAATILRPFLGDRRQKAENVPIDAAPPPSIAVISAADALKWHQAQTALFADARSEDDFRHSRIQGAVHLPVQATEQWLDVFLAETPPDVRIITYCGDPACHLARDLADLLLMAGFENVYYMQEGLQQWMQSGLPLAEENE